MGKIWSLRSNEHDNSEIVFCIITKLTAGARSSLRLYAMFLVDFSALCLHSTRCFAHFLRGLIETDKPCS